MGSIVTGGVLVSQAPLQKQLWEIAAKDYQILNDGVSVEVEGVCKFSDDSVQCWKPSGSNNKPLADKIRAVKYFGFQTAYGKKYRVLFYRVSVLNSKGFDQGHPNQLPDNNQSFKENWSYYASDFESFRQEINGTQTTLKYVPGFFNLETKEFPFRYQFNSTSLESVVIPIKLGRFEVDGNTYEITSIADHQTGAPLSKNTYFRNFGVKTVPAKTDITIRQISVTQPASTVVVNLATANGKAIHLVDESDEPVTIAQLDDWNRSNSTLDSNSRAAKVPFHEPGIGSIPAISSNQPGTQIVWTFAVDRSKCERLLLAPSREHSYVFENIRLDPK
ncbi:MAG: hypothetical protein WCG75_02645 [Armatimonadota bacterium]